MSNISHLESARKYREANREKIREYARNWTAEHPVESAQYRKNWNEANRKKRQGYWLKFNYGITIEQFDSMIINQNGLCLLCLEQLTATLVVDHNHETKIVRGILCSSCNHCLKGFEKPEEWQVRARDYLANTEKDDDDY